MKAIGAVQKMKRPGDNISEPPGGRVAERLRMFERARGAADQSVEAQTKKPGTKLKKGRTIPEQLTPKAERSSHEKQDRSAD